MTARESFYEFINLEVVVCLIISFKERVSIAILLDFSGNRVKIKIQLFVLGVFISSSR